MEAQFTVGATVKEFADWVNAYGELFYRKATGFWFVPFGYEDDPNGDGWIMDTHAPKGFVRFRIRAEAVEYMTVQAETLNQSLAPSDDESTTTYFAAMLEAIELKFTGTPVRRVRVAQSQQEKVQVSDQEPVQYSFALPTTQREFLQWLEPWVQVDGLKPGYEFGSLTYFVGKAEDARGIVLELSQQTPERLIVKFAPWVHGPEDENETKWGWSFLEPKPENVTIEQRRFVAELSRAIWRKWPEQAMSGEGRERNQQRKYATNDLERVQSAVKAHDLDGLTWEDSAERVGLSARQLQRLRKKYRPDTLGQ